MTVFFEAKKCYVHGSNILAFLPVPAKSHLYIYKPILEDLAKRNHSIIAFVSIPQNIISSNYKEFVIESKALALLKDTDFFPENQDVQTFGKRRVLELASIICEDGFSNPEFQKLIRLSENYEFDLILNEIPFYQFSAAVLGYVFNAPMIALNSHGLTNLEEEFSGDPSYLPYVPDLSLPYGSKMSYFQRLHNTLYKFSTNIYNYMYNLPHHEKLIKKYFQNHNFPPLREMLKNISLFLINSHPCIIPRPYAPTTIEIGGIHIDPNENNTLPKDLQKFMDDASEGVIYFSLGSNIPAHRMPKYIFDAFVKLFSNIKQKVLWKVELNNTNEILLNTKNILIKSWVPQKNILAHKNCQIFITHGGLLSLEEAIWFGVPLIGIPFFGDQPMNMERVHSAGFGIRIEYRNVSFESLTWAVKEIQNKPYYRETAKCMSKIFRDNSQTPLEKAVYWIEYVIKHKGTPYLKSPVNDLPWYQCHLFDIYLSVVLIFVFIICTLHLLVKYIFNIFVKLINVRKSCNLMKNKNE